MDRKQRKKTLGVGLMFCMALFLGILMIGNVSAWSNSTFNNSLAAENITFSGDQNFTRWLSVPENSIVTNGFMNLSGRVFNEEFFDLIAPNSKAIGIDSNGTHIWTTNSDTDKVYMYLNNGTVVNSWSTSNNPWGVTQNGTFVWVSNPGADIVIKYWMNGTGTGETFPTVGVGDPDNREITHNNTFFWIVDRNDKRVYRYWMNGTNIDFFSTTAANSNPAGVTTNNTFIWVSNGVDANGFVYKYWMNGTYTGENFSAGVGGAFSIASSNSIFYTTWRISVPDKIYRRSFTSVSNPFVSINNIDIFNYTGEFDITNQTENFASTINSFLSGCSILNGFCLVPFIFHSDLPGVFEYFNLIFNNDGVIENSQTYPTSSVETATETYIANLTYDSNNFNVITGLLNLNGTQYTGTKTGTGDNAIFTTNTVMPSLAIETNFSAYWTISLTDIDGTTDYNLTSNNVTVTPINLSLCDATTNVPFWNFTIFNETNVVEVNSTFEVTFNVKPTGATIENIFSFSDVTETNSTFDFCISPGTESYTVDASIKLTKSGFVDKFYNYQEVVVTNSTREDNLYMMATGDSTSFIVHVVDVSATDITGAEVRVQRYYPGTGEWLTTEILTTNYVGEAVGHLLSEDADYRFNVYQSGISVYNSSATKITCAVAPCTVTLVIPIESATGYEEVEDLTSTLTFDSSTDIFTYTYSDTSGDFSQARLFVFAVFPSNATQIIVCDETKTTASGVITCDLTGQYNGTYQASGYITRDGDEFLDKRINGNLGSKVYDAMGDDGVLWGFFVLISIIMLGITRPSLAIIFGSLGLMVLWLIGLINIGVISIVAVISIAIILLMRVGKE